MTMTNRFEVTATKIKQSQCGIRQHNINKLWSLEHNDDDKCTQHTHTPLGWSVCVCEGGNSIQRGQVKQRG